MSKVYFKPHSAGWITPDGEFKLIRGDMMHDDAAENFPGMPKDETMPSQYAVSQLGYLRVSNAFDFIADTLPRRGDPRMERMAQFTADAVLEYARRGAPGWLAFKLRSHSTMLQWEVRFATPGSRYETMTVEEFVDRYGSRETSERLFNYFLSKLHERLLRAMINHLIREARRLRV